MSLITCGLNYKTAPIALREKFAFSREKVAPALLHLKQQINIDEAVLLSTCNRTEVHCHTASTPQAIVEWLSEIHALPAANLAPYLYIHENNKMVRHVFRVASGMDSMVLGEPQIFGQLKEAVKIAETSGMLGKNLKRLFQQAFSVGKQIRTHTKIGSNPITLGYAVLQLAQRIFADLKSCRVLLVGAGETTQLIAKYLQRSEINHLSVANRTIASAQSFAENLQASVISLQDIPQQLAQTDILVTAIQSELPIIGKGFIESAIKLRKHRPMLIVDLGMPRNVEPEIQQLEDIYLYAIDDLQHILQENHDKRQDALHLAEEMITIQTDHFIASLQALQTTKMIQQYRGKFQQMRDEALAVAFQELALGDNPQDVLERFSHRLTSKFLHQPSKTLRQAGYEGNWELVNLFEKSFLAEK